MCRMMVVPWSLRQPGVMVKVMPSADSQCTGSAPSSQDSVSISTFSDTMNTL